LASGPESGLHDGGLEGVISDHYDPSSGVVDLDAEGVDGGSRGGLEGGWEGWGSLDGDLVVSAGVAAGQGGQCKQPDHCDQGQRDEGDQPVVYECHGCVQMKVCGW